MHKKGRRRGKMLRYIKNPSKSFFSRINSVAEKRAVDGQRKLNSGKKNRKPQMPESTIPEDSQAPDGKE